MPPTPATTPTAVIETTLGTMTVAFWPDVAPGHVKNFIDLAKKGFYNNLIFHRVIRDFMIQGGCPDGTGMGSNGSVRLKAEFNKRPDRRHTRGTLSMARSNDPNSASCQFFIVHKDSSHLDGQYTAFGTLTAGLDTLDKIASLPTKGDHPLTPPKITKNNITE